MSPPCRTCAKGSFSDSAATVCISCAHGKYRDAETDCRCSYDHEQHCQNCPAGTSAPSGKYTVGNGTHCTICPAGKHASAAGAGSACALPPTLPPPPPASESSCDAGFYTPDPAEAAEPRASVTCSGTCDCTPSSGQVLGTISDGPNRYGIDELCHWVVAAPGMITLTVTSLDTKTSYDRLVIQRCQSSANPSSCIAGEQLASLSGSGTAAMTYTTTKDRPYLYVQFYSAFAFRGSGTSGDYHIVLGTGFSATWSTDAWRDDARICRACPQGQYSATPGSSACLLCLAGTFSASFSATACTNCSAPAGHYCPQQSSSASGLICPLGYSCPGGAHDKLRCPSAIGVGWSYCPEPLAISAIQSSASGGTFAEVCPKTPVQSFGEPQYRRCELRWSWTDLYTGHENKSIIFKTGTVGEWAVYLYVSESVLRMLS